MHSQSKHYDGKYTSTADHHDESNTPFLWAESLVEPHQKRGVGDAAAGSSDITKMKRVNLMAQPEADTESTGFCVTISPSLILITLPAISITLGSWVEKIKVVPFS